MKFLDENEFLRILKALEQKLGSLKDYEDLLIKEAETLRNMYESMYMSLRQTEELLTKFDSQKTWFFNSFSDRIEDAMETKLRTLLNKYNISITLSKGDKE